MDERQVSDQLLEGTREQGLLLGGLQGRPDRRQAGERRSCQGEEERHRLPKRLLWPIVRLRGRVETEVAELTEQLGLARHGAKSFWGLVARTAATALAHTITILRLA